MWLVLCFPHDAAACWAVGGLRRRGLVPIEAVSPGALVCSRALVHEITNGQSRTTFTLPDGRVIDSAVVRGSLNRVTALPLAHLDGAGRDDVLYAQQELYALVLSVLHGLGERIVNRPTPQGLAGRVRTDAEWLWLAGRAGFRTPDYREGDLEQSRMSDVPDGTPVRAIVFDDRVYGMAVPPEVGACAMALARLAATRLLGVDLVETPQGDWWFSAASITPDFRPGGEALLDALATALVGPTT
jgi:hypothetical protein